MPRLICSRLMSLPLSVTLPTIHPLRATFELVTVTVFPRTKSESEFFALSPNAWMISGASMPTRRIVCSCLFASRTVSVSPSAIATTLPVMVCGCAAADRPSAKRINNALMGALLLILILVLLARQYRLEDRIKLALDPIDFFTRCGLFGAQRSDLANNLRNLRPNLGLHLVPK